MGQLIVRELQLLPYECFNHQPHQYEHTVLLIQSLENVILFSLMTMSYYLIEVCLSWSLAGQIKEMICINVIIFVSYYACLYIYLKGSSTLVLMWNQQWILDFKSEPVSYIDPPLAISLMCICFNTKVQGEQMGSQAACWLRWHAVITFCNSYSSSNSNWLPRWIWLLPLCNSSNIC